MRIKTIWTTICLIAITTLGFGLPIEELNAETKTKTQDKTDITIGDRASYLQNLERRSASQWTFPTDNRVENLTRYELSFSVPEVRLIEQKPPKWRNTGDDPNYSVLVDVYEFDIEEFKNNISN